MAKRETGLFQRQGSAVWHYDFRVRGHRFSGSTGTANRAEAARFVRDKKAAAREAVSAPTAPLTFGRAATRLWEEVGQHCAKPREIMAQLACLQAEIGNSTPLATITNDVVARLVARRRADCLPQSAEDRKAGKPAVRISAATVNRSVTQPLRRILKRAEDAWDQPVARINWRQHLLKEAGERVREATEDEEARIFEHLHEDMHAPVLFAILSGCRLNEVVGLRWDWIDWGGRKISIHGKGDKIASIPLSKGLRDLLWPLQGKHEEFVFTYTPTERQASAKANARPVPMKFWNLAYFWQKARRAAGIPNSRENRVAGLRFHDLRHTTATRILRHTGNLKMVKELLRHSSIATTGRYAHVLDHEIADAMDAVSTRKAKAS
jgi:integrase